MTTMERRPDSRGKVRDIYDAGENLLMVATDRISAFDFILPDEIPFKGEVLNRISAFWFDKFADIVPNHLVSIDPADFPEEFAEYRDYLAGRAMLVKKAQTIPIECIVRGYLTGSGKKTYDENGTVCGIQLPEGLTEASKLPEPLFTPSTKAEIGDHDENISFERCCEIVGEDIATQIRDLSLKIYKAAAEYAATRGIIIADTKFEFGVIDGKVTLIARQAASSVRVVPASSKARRKELEKGENLEGLSKEEKRARKAKQRAKEDRIYTVSNILLKQDEDYTKRRRIWWIVLAIGMVLVVAIWASLYFAPAGMVSSPVQMVGIVLSYVVILGDFIYDFVRIRPLRNMYRAQAEGMSENKLNALIERSAAEEDKKDSKKK